MAAPIAAGLLLLGAALTAFAMWRGAHPAPDDDGRRVVAVADFANKTLDPDLDGLSGLLVTSLEQSRKLRVLTRGRLIALAREMGEGDAPHIDESLARAVGKKAGVRTLLLASIQQLGDTYAAELRAVDPRKDGSLFTVREEAKGKSDLLALVDRLSGRTRLALREPGADVKASEVNVGEAVTGSLEAYRHYFRGKELAARGAPRDAIAELGKAIEIEPRFALARLEIAWLRYFSGASRATARGRAAASDLVREAARDATHAPEKEAGLLRALAAFLDGRFAASRAEIRSLTARYPDDPDVAAPAAEILARCGYFEDAVPAFERALRLAPDRDLLRYDQVRVLAGLGRADDGLRLAEKAARARGTPTARAVAAVAHYLVGDGQGGISALRSLGADDALARASLAEGLAAQGSVEDALATTVPLQAPFGDGTRARIRAHAGQLRAGLAAVEASGRWPGADATHETAARYLAAAGDLEGARERADRGDFFTVLDGVMLASIGDERRLGRLVGELEQGSPFNARFLRAIAAYRAGERGKALAELRALDEGTASFVTYFRGLAAAEEGRDEEAVSAFRRFERPVFFASDGFEAPWFLARARFLMARSLDRLGRRDEARKVLDFQLARWSDADPELPLLADMRALRAELGRGAASR